MKRAADPTQLDPPVRVRRGQTMGLVVGLMVVVGLVASAAIRSDDVGSATHLESAGGDASVPTPAFDDPATSTTTPAATSSSTMASATTGPRRPTTPSTGAAAPAAADTSTTSSTTSEPSPLVTTTTAPDAPEAEPVHRSLTIDQAGIWVLDVAAGELRRIADAGTFDVGGETLFTTKGRDVFATPLAGGATVKRYTAPSQADPQLSGGYRVDYTREAVAGIDATSDGTAVVAVFAPLLSPTGGPGGRSGDYYLLGPGGQTIQPAHPLQPTAQWDVGGTQLVTTSYAPAKTIVVLGRDGKTLHGPYSGPQVDAVTRLSWATHGRALAVDDGQGGYHRFDPLTGTFSAIPGVSASGHIGPDDRVLGIQSDTNGNPSVHLFDPATGTIRLFAPRGDQPTWSPDGRSVVIDDRPEFDSSLGLVVTDNTARPRYTVTAGGALGFGRSSGLGLIGKTWPSAEWSASSRYLVIVARPR